MIALHKCVNVLRHCKDTKNSADTQGNAQVFYGTQISQITQIFYSPHDRGDVMKSVESV